MARFRLEPDIAHRKVYIAGTIRSDPFIIWNRDKKEWFLFHMQRRSTEENSQEHIQ